ncbi:MAG TPA: sugar transferase [Anaerolineales bacterium]|nr:sugar transferase [Anaerolineales bacterium]
MDFAEESQATRTVRSRSWRLRTGERRALLVFGDLLAAGSAMLAALFLWARFDYLGPEPSLEFLRARAPWFVSLPLIWLVLMVNLYDVHRASSWREMLRGVIFAALVGGVLYLALFFTADGSLPRRGVAYFLALAGGLTLVWRAGYIRIFTAPTFMRRVLLVGAGETGTALVRVIKGLWPPPFYLVGMVDDDQKKQGRDFEGAAVLGDNRSLQQVIEEEGVSDIVVAISGPMSGEMFQSLLDAQQHGVEITRMPAAYEDLLGRVPINHLESDWLLRSFMDEARVSGFYLLGKRILDILGGLLGMLIFLLALPLIAITIALESGRPIFYRQARLGQGGRLFEVIKLRTMRADAEAHGQAQWAQVNDPRATFVGRLLRRIHLDEFPQFWNVLKGQMSLVGPRPERPELVAELEQEIPFYRARLLVKPGITGWAQVNYGKGASVEGSAEKLEFDLYYIKHRSMLMDLWIVLRTAGAVLRLRGV